MTEIKRYKSIEFVQVSEIITNLFQFVRAFHRRSSSYANLQQAGEY